MGHTRIDGYNVSTKRKKPSKVRHFGRLFSLGAGEGVEPSRCRQRWILSPVRLPIPPPRQWTKRGKQTRPASQAKFASEPTPYRPRWIETAFQRTIGLAIDSPSKRHKETHPSQPIDDNSPFQPCSKSTPSRPATVNFLPSLHLLHYDTPSPPGNKELS